MTGDSRGLSSVMESNLSQIHMCCFGQNRLGEGKGVSLNNMLMNKFIAFKEPTIAIQNKLDFEVHCWDSTVESVLLLVASPTNSE